MTATAARPRPPLPSRWTLAAAPDSEVVERLGEELHLPPALCRLLALRGHGDVDEAKTYLRPRLERLSAPELLVDLSRAVERIAKAIRGGETILVHGDYDVDGICSTTLLTRTLRHLIQSEGSAARVVPFIPRRLEDGYDLGAAGVGAAATAGATVVVTCDCGTTAHAPIDDLQRLGIDVIVTDHHLPSGPMPRAFAVLNPKRADCQSPEKDLAAVGVVFKLALALAAAMGSRQTVNIVYGMLDLVALATVADVAPLRGENRIMVRTGLRLLRETNNVGLGALIRASGLHDKQLTAGRIAFILAPRLNAVGRLGHALRGVELLMSEDQHEANRIARELEELNVKRQEIDRAILVRTREMVEQMDLDETFGIVLAERDWHPGVIGIVASRIVEEFGRPTVLVALDGAQGKGSGRSISAFDLHAGLASCRDLLIRFGGHRAAAGITIAADRVPEFAHQFNAVARDRLTANDLVPELRLDLEITLAEATAELEALLRHLEPCGIGNPSPLFVARRVAVASAPRCVGKDGLRVRFEGAPTGTADAPVAGAALSAIGWGMADRASELRPGQTVDVAFRLERDEWNGESRIQARLVDFRT